MFHILASHAYLGIQRRLVEVGTLHFQLKFVSICFLVVVRGDFLITVLHLNHCDIPMCSMELFCFLCLGGLLGRVNICGKLRNARLIKKLLFLGPILFLLKLGLLQWQISKVICSCSPFPLTLSTPNNILNLLCLLSRQNFLLSDVGHHGNFTIGGASLHLTLQNQGGSNLVELVVAGGLVSLV